MPVNDWMAFDPKVFLRLGKVRRDEPPGKPMKENPSVGGGGKRGPGARRAHRDQHNPQFWRETLHVA